MKRLKFGDYVLLQPELLDAYAGAMVNAARDEPDGLGSILETKVVNVDFPVPAAERVRERLQERLLVLATLEELLQRELVLREPTKDGVQLVFPSAYLRDLPTSEMPKGDGVIFRFEGPIQNIYATLIVRLTRTDRFSRVDTWQSAARFAAEEGDVHRRPEVRDRGRGRAADRVRPGARRRQEAVRALRARAPRALGHARSGHQGTPVQLPGLRAWRSPRTWCTGSSAVVGSASCARSARSGSRCGTTTTPTAPTSRRPQMDASADVGREIAAASAVLRGKEEVAEYDVFLSYHWPDKDAVRLIAQQLKNRGLRPWMDERQLRPGSCLAAGP